MSLSISNTFRHYTIGTNLATGEACGALLPFISAAPRINAHVQFRVQSTLGEGRVEKLENHHAHMRLRT